MVLVAHGSRDPRAAASTRALVRAVAAARPGLDVRAAYLEHTLPRPDQALDAMAASGHAGATVVPLLLTAAYHGRVDLPAVLAAHADRRARGLAVRVTDVLGPVAGRVPAELLTALRRRLDQLGTAYDAVVLAAAGTRDATARVTVDEAAAALGAALGVPCRAGYATTPPRPPELIREFVGVSGGVSLHKVPDQLGSAGDATGRSATPGAGPAAVPLTAGEATEALHAAGARRVVAAAYFLAPGKLYQAAADSALAAGALAVAEPLGGAAEMASLVLSRAAAVRPEPGPR
jgi:sirohydrochlorin ferrochelatase